MRVKLLSSEHLPTKFRNIFWDAKELKEKKLQFWLYTKIGNKEYKLKKPVPLWFIKR